MIKVAQRPDLCLLLCASLSYAAAAYAAEVTYPTRPIRLLVPTSPGGGTDTLARILAPRLGEALGQQWIVDNRAGAAGNIAMEFAARAVPDGYTAVLALNHVVTVNPTIYKLPYDVLRDLQPVTALAGAQYLLGTASWRACRNREGIRGAGETEARDAQRGLGRNRYSGAPGGGALQEARGCGPGPRPVQGVAVPPRRRCWRANRR